VPYWPNWRCGDFQAFSTVGWWYNYRPMADVREEQPWWCKCPSGETDACLPDPDDKVVHVPMIPSLPGYGVNANLTLPDAAAWNYYLLGWNEPNQEDHANIPPEVAAEAWIELQEKYPEQVLVSPACSGMNTAWMDEFFDRCSVLGCRIDYVATHSYNPDPDVTMSKLEEYSRRYNKQIWLTEFAMRNEHNKEKILAFVENLVPRLEAADFIWRYSWFVARYYESQGGEGEGFWVDANNSLLEFDRAELTAVGQAYDMPYHENFKL